MPLLKTCRSCAVDKSACERRTSLLSAVRGHGVGVISHRCPDHRVMFRPGQPVWVYVNDAPHSEYDEYDDCGPTRDWYPGYFLSVSKTNTRGIVIVMEGAVPRGTESGREEDALKFQPIRPTNGRASKSYGPCKVTWARIEARDGEDEPLCPSCGDPWRVTGCGDREWQTDACGIGVCGSRCAAKAERIDNAQAAE